MVPSVQGLDELFSWRCHGHRDRLAYAFVRDSLDLADQCTYGELEGRTRRLAQALWRHAQTGDRVLLLFPPGLEVALAFWACVLAGVVPVPAPSPDPVRSKHAVPRLRAILGDSGARLVLTNDERNRFARDGSDISSGDSVKWISLDRLEAEQGDAPSSSRPATPLAYLQYTSGSTTNPRGVMITHQNILAQCRGLVALAQVDDQSRSLCWLPYFHDYGLVHGIIAPFYAGIPAYMMSPLTFLRRPLRWLEAIDRWEITHSGAPHFAYASCVRALLQADKWTCRLDRWKAASCGAEPIQPQTIDRFCRAFEPHGFSPRAFMAAYGLAESTLVVTSTRPGEGPSVLPVAGAALEAHRVEVTDDRADDVRLLTGCGKPMSEMEVAIIDPETGSRCQPDYVGEVWVSGSSVADGYWNRSDLTSETFGVFLDGDVSKPYLRTGDLGFIRNGQLFITGRLKDLIILNGRNLYPTDLETAIEGCHGAVRPGGTAAFSIEEEAGEQVVIVQEVERSRDLNPEDVATAIRLVLAERFEVPVREVVLVRSGSIPRTSSGKIQRQACRKAYLNRTLPIVAASRAVPEDASTRRRTVALPDSRRMASDDHLDVEPYLIRLFTEQLHATDDHVKGDIPLVNLGLDSLATSLIKHRVEQDLGIELAFSQLFGEWTIRDLAAHITEAKSLQPENQPPIDGSGTGGDQSADFEAIRHPLSVGQERLWFAEQLKPGSALNHVSMAMRLKGPFRRDWFNAGIAALVRRHDMLRTGFVSAGGQAYQTRTEEVALPVQYRSLDATSAQDADEEIARWIRESTVVPFELDTPPLMRILVLEVTDHDRVCIMTVHRLIADGWSLRLFWKELETLYNAGGRDTSTGPLPPQPGYLEYAHCQRRWLASDKRDRQLTYWQRQLDPLPPLPDLPTDRPRPRIQQFQGGVRTLALSSARRRGLEHLSRRHGTTKFMVCYAAFVAWLQRCTRVADIVVGSVVANRNLAQWEHVFGYCANTVALRMDLSDVFTVESLLARSRRVVSEAYDNQDVPFELVLGSLGAEREATSGRIFNVMLVWEDDPFGDLQFRDLSISRLPIEDAAAEFDLTLLVVNSREGIELVMLYDRALFDGLTVDHMLSQLDTLIGAMAEDPDALLSNLSLLGEEEKRRVLTEWNDTACDLPVPGSLPEVIDHKMQQRPETVAVVCGDARLSYRQLRALVNSLAQAIYRISSGRNLRVALCVDRSIWSLAGPLGILRAGAAYVPLDPDAPEHRQRLIVQDVEPALVVTQRHLRSRLPFEPERIIELDTLEAVPKTSDVEFQAPGTTPDHLAYVIYTSGSSGRPKGVEVTHGALLHSLGARLLYYQDPVSSCLLTFPLAFDGSITSIFWSLLHAGTLVIPSTDESHDPARLATLITRERVSHVVWVPSLYDVVLQEVPASTLASLRVVVTAGEVLPPALVRRHYELVPDAVLYNEYGPTEATVWATVYRTSGTEQGMRIPIGKPIANTTVYMLDENLTPVPVGMVGEIVIGGAALARGYRNLPSLTGEKFVSNPFRAGTRLYRTGDLGRRRPDGEIEFIGRADQQVKVRGYRIELAEIETNLKDLPGVRDAAVIVQDSPATGPVLLAFVAADDGATSAGSHLLEQLKRRVPAYMVPAAVEVVDRLPLLPSGKIDRAALRRYVPLRSSHASMFVRPRDPVEQSLLDIWSEVLGVHPVDIHQSFFALGGHSLLATQVVSRIREVFRVEVPLRALFEAPTIAGVAEQIRLAQRKAGSLPPLPPIVPVSRAAPLPLSYSQQRMWFVQQLAPEATAYNLLFVSRQKGPFRIPVFRRVVDILSRRHEAFRTTFAMTGAGLVQRIVPRITPHVVEIDLRRLPQSEREREARRIAEEEGARPFDLERGPLARISLIRLDHEDHLLVLNLHHIVGDQWSFGILGREFAGYYNALCQGQPLPESPLPVQYADYAVWQRRCLTDNVLKEQEAYWTRTLDRLPILHLPTDFPRPALQTFRGSYCSVEIPGSIIEKLKTYGSRHQVTSFMTMLACFQILLSRYSGQRDVAVGTPIANRTQMVMEQLIGTFVNTLVLRVDLNGEPSFAEVVERVKEAALGAFANQDYPFDRLVETLQVERDPSMPPLVQVLFNMVNAPIGDIQLWGLKWEPFEVDPGSSQFDLSLTVELEAAKKAYLTFNTDLFTRETAQRILNHYVALLESGLNTPDRPVSELSMLSPEERTQLLEEWNRTAADYPRTMCLPELVTAQSEKTPEAVAVSMDGVTLTYRELRERSNRMARAFSRIGVARPAVVGICLERSVEMVVVLLAVMKAGGCYVPLDPEYPRDRLRYMVEDSGASFVVTTTALSERFGGLACKMIRLDRAADEYAEEQGQDLIPVLAPEDVAYILYTSGSTGQPKGVEIRHRSLVNFLWSMKREPGCSAQDVLLSVTTLSFDIAGLELYLPLVSGGRVEIATRDVVSDGRHLVACMEKVQPTIMQATPATWRLLLDAGWTGSPGLTALCGGEALPRDLADRLCARTKALWNMYGPTETTIWSTIDRVESGNHVVTIGRPIANTEIYILDARMQPVPVGVSGEVYIGGDGLAKGYHKRPELSAERFVRHPFSPHEGARLYRTGDIARYRPDGRIIHQGRIDHQVKIRGYRIELGEIESVLSRHPRVKQAVVTARDDQHGLKQLAAYVSPQAGASLTSEELRSFLRAILPEYMVPSVFVSLQSFPLTANKKVDLRALPLPDFSSQTGRADRVAPRTGLEVQLTALWQQVLDVQEIGIHDNFFDLGGHSLKAAQLFYQLELVFGKQLPLATLFQAPTVAELAAILVKENWTPPWQSLVAIQPAGSATPLFMVPGVGGNVLVFAKLATLLGHEQPVYGLQARGLDGKESPFTSVPEMAAHYVRQIKGAYPTGPYMIAGVCTGGLIAYEMGQQLLAQGDRATLFLLDTWHPDSYSRYKNMWWGRVFMAGVIVEKTWTDLRMVLRMPVKVWWPNIKRKGRVLISLLSQSVNEEIQDQDFRVQRLTQATFLAVSRYRVKAFAGKVVNVIAAQRRVNEVNVDTRHRWIHLADKHSVTVEIPAEDSGRLFVSPYVEELAGHLQRHLRPETHSATARGRREIDDVSA